MFLASALLVFAATTSCDPRSDLNIDCAWYVEAMKDTNFGQAGKVSNMQVINEEGKVNGVLTQTGAYCTLAKNKEMSCIGKDYEWMLTTNPEGSSGSGSSGGGEGEEGGEEGCNEGGECHGADFTSSACNTELKPKANCLESAQFKKLFTFDVGEELESITYYDNVIYYTINHGVSEEEGMGRGPQTVDPTLGCYGTTGQDLYTTMWDGVGLQVFKNDGDLYTSIIVSGDDYSPYSDRMNRDGGGLSWECTECGDHREADEPELETAKWEYSYSSGSLTRTSKSNGSKETIADSVYWAEVGDGAVYYARDRTVYWNGDCSPTGNCGTDTFTCTTDGVTKIGRDPSLNCDFNYAKCPCGSAKYTCTTDGVTKLSLEMINKTCSYNISKCPCGTAKYTCTTDGVTKLSLELINNTCAYDYSKCQVLPPSDATLSVTIKSIAGVEVSGNQLERAKYTIDLEIDRDKITSVNKKSLKINTSSVVTSIPFARVTDQKYSTNFDLTNLAGQSHKLDFTVAVIVNKTTTVGMNFTMFVAATAAPGTIPTLNITLHKNQADVLSSDIIRSESYTVHVKLNSINAVKTFTLNNITITTKNKQLNILSVLPFSKSNMVTQDGGLNYYSTPIVLSGMQRRYSYGLTISADATDSKSNNIRASLEKNIPMEDKIKNPYVIIE
jgi:hypothetical protein